LRRISASHLVAKTIDFINKCTENEHIFWSNFFSDFNVSSVHGTDDERTVENEFHVRSATCFETSGRDVLTEFGSGNDDLSVRNVVVCEVNNLQKITNVTVVVDLFLIRKRVIINIAKFNLKFEHL